MTSGGPRNSDHHGELTLDLFCHISEFGPIGMQNVPTLAFIADRLTLWSPSASFIQAGQQSGTCMLSPHDVLQLVRDRKIQVMGRERWFYDRKFRDNHPGRYRYAAWDSSFDTELALMATQDTGNALEDRRVVVAKDEDGLAWADEVLDSNDEAHIEFQDMAQRVLTTPLTTGLREKLEQCTSNRERSAVVLRDLRNHRRAFLDAQADKVVILAVDAAEYAGIVGEDTAPPDGGGPPPDPNRVADLIELLTTLSRPRSGEDLLKLLNSTHRDTFQREAKTLLASEQPLDSLLLSEVLKGTTAASWREVLVGKTVPQASSRLVFSIGGLLTGLATFQFAPAATIGLVIQAAQMASPVAEKLGYIRAANYNGATLPFVLGYDSADPTYREIRAVVEVLQGLIAGERGTKI